METDMTEEKKEIVNNEQDPQGQAEQAIEANEADEIGVASEASDEKLEQENPVVEQLAESTDTEPDQQPEQSESLAESAEQNVEAEPAENKQQITEPDPTFEPTVESVVEAVLFASDESLSPGRLAEIAGVSGKQLRQHIENLNEKYKTNNNAFRIEQIAGGYQMQTLPGYNHWLKKLVRAREESSLSQPALETLAIIAYKQPIIRADIEAIRGVAAGEMIRNLMYKGLVKIAGRAEVVGRPMLYGTTKKFLEVFGLNSLKDLPKAEELKKPE
jgi:segregation and condensation protein B